MREVKIYSTKICTFCVQTKRFLTHLQIPFEEIQLDEQPDLRQELSVANGHYRTVPMIYVDNKFIGGYTDLLALHKKGLLLD